jgi:hypothetical protein
MKKAIMIKKFIDALLAGLLSSQAGRFGYETDHKRIE